VRALLSAEMIVLGPGSLYTSLIPNLLIREIHDAFRASRAFKVYVCNVATQPGETDGYTVQDHLTAIHEHVGPDLVDVVVTNRWHPADLPRRLEWVESGAGDLGAVRVYPADLADPERPWRHGSARLADVLVSLLEERTGPLESPRAESPSPTGDGNGNEPQQE
jgi:uncharacterized cofD-like protein